MIKRASRDRPSSTRAEKLASRKKSGFVYKERTTAAVKARAEQSGGRFDSPFKQGIDTWRPKDGDNLIRILPPTWEGHDNYGYDVWVHRFVGPDNSTYICPRKMKQKDCPICDAEREARDAGETEEAKALAPAKIVACWILDRDDDSDSPVLYAMSWTMDRDISALCFNKRSGKTLMPDHPDDGFDLTIKRKGQGIKTRYFGLALDREPSPIHDDQKVQDEILDFIQENPIPSTLHYHPADYLEKVISGTAEERDEDLDEEEGAEDEGKGSKTARKSRRPARDEKDEDDGEEDDDAESEEGDKQEGDDGEGAESAEEADEGGEDSEVLDEEEDAPRGRKSTARPSRRDKDEETEEDQEEAPSRRGSVSRRRPAREEPRSSRTRRGSDDDEPEEEEEEKTTRRSATRRQDNPRRRSPRR